MGSGGTQNISRFVDAGVYLYHRGASSLSTRPDYIRITSPTGDVAVAKVQDWLPTDEEDEWKGPGYQEDFVTSYLTPTELYERIHQLAEEFPHLAEIVELPYKTNGYQRKAMASMAAYCDGALTQDQALTASSATMNRARSAACSMI